MTKATCLLMHSADTPPTLTPMHSVFHGMMQ